MAELKPFAGNLDAAPQAYDGPLDGEAPKPAGAMRKLGDVGIALGQGVVGGVKAITDVAGAGNKVSRALDSANQGLSGFLSPQRAREISARQAKIKEAEASGSTLDEIGANLGGFAEAPASTIAQGLGSIAPTVAAAFIPGGQAAAAARGAAMLGLGAAQGAGAVKGSIYDATSDQHVAAGMDPAQAAARADEAQAYGGQNADNIAMGAGLGAVAGRFGAEGAIAKLTGGAPARLGAVRRIATGAAEEGVTEATQGGQERYSSNVALQREGFDVPTMQGVAGQAAVEGLVGGIIGGGVGAIPGGPPAPPPSTDLGADSPDVGAVNQAAPQTEAIVSGQGGGIAPPQAPPKPPAAPPAPPPSKAQAMGINPAAGPLSAGAAIAVDTGADVITQTQEVEKQKAEAKAKEKTKPGADGKKPEPEAPAPVQPVTPDPTAPITGPFTQAIHGAANVTPTPAPTVDPQGPATPEGVGAQPDAPAAPGVGADQGPTGAGAVPAAVPEPVAAPVTPPPTQESINATQQAIQGETIDPETGEIIQPGAQGAGGDGGQRTEDALQPGADAKGPQPAPDQPAAPAAAGTPAEGKPAAPTEPVDLGAHTAATSPHNDRPEPTQAQKEAGNYKKAHLVMSGLEISIENPQGSTRSGVDPDGKAWSSTMTGHYGYVKRTTGSDGEQQDVYVKPGTPLDYAGPVFVVDQIDPKTGKHDEYKSMIGYRSGMEARKAYMSNYAAGWNGLKSVRRWEWDDFKKWVKSEGTKAPPAAGKPAPDAPATTPQSAPTSAPSPDTTSSATAPAGPDPAPTQAAAPSKTESVSPAATGPSPDGTQATAKSNTLRVGTMPTNAEPVTIKDGVIYIGKYEALNFDTGEPVRIAPDANPLQIRKALADNKALGTHQKVFGGVAPVETPAITPDVKTAPVDVQAPVEPAAQPEPATGLNPLQKKVKEARQKKAAEAGNKRPTAAQVLDAAATTIPYGKAYTNTEGIRQKGRIITALTNLGLKPGEAQTILDRAMTTEARRRMPNMRFILPMDVRNAADDLGYTRLPDPEPAAKPAEPAAPIEPKAAPASINTLPLAERWDALVAHTKTDGGDPDKGQRSYRAFTQLVGSVGEDKMVAWSRWSSHIGSTELVNRTGPEVLKWMEEGLVGRLDGYNQRLPGNQMGITSRGDTRYWQTALDEIERRSKDHNNYMDRLEKQARDVEELGGDAKRVAEARATVMASNKAYSANERRAREGLKEAEVREKEKALADTAAEAAKYKPFDAKELSKKPTPGSMSGWFTANYEGKTVWTQGTILDVGGTPPHLIGYQTRMDTLGRNKDGKLDVSRVIPRQKGPQATPFGFYDGEYGKSANGLVYFDAEGRLIGVNATFFRYFASKYKGAEFFASPDGDAITVRHDGKTVGVIMPIRITGAKVGEAAPTVADIKAKIGAQPAAPAQEAPRSPEADHQAAIKDVAERRRKAAEAVRASAVKKTNANSAMVWQIIGPDGEAVSGPPGTYPGRELLAGTPTMGNRGWKTKGEADAAFAELNRKADEILGKEPAKNAASFIPTPGGGIDYGEITAEMSKAMRRQPGMIRLQQGNALTGLQHIEKRHGEQIRAMGFADVPAFLLDSLRNIEAIWRPDTTSQLVVVQAQEKGRAVFIELRPDATGDFYRVNTAFPTGKDYAENKEGWKSLWSREPVPASSTGEPPSFAVPADKTGQQATVVSSQSEVPSLPEQDKPSNTENAGAGKVENFGETLPPARRNMAAKLDEELTNDDIANRPLSEIWPLAENEAIEDNFAAAVAHAARAEIPSKPRVAYKLKSWVTKVQALRELGARIVSGRVTRERFIELVPASLKDWLTKVMLLEQVSRDQWSRIETVEERPDSFTYDASGKQVEAPMVRVKIDGRSHWLTGDSGVEGGARGTLDGNKAGIMALLSNEAPEERMQFEVRQRRGGKVFVNKKGDSEYRALMEFDTAEDARKAITGQYDDLVAAWDATKARDNITERDLRSVENRPRAGKDHRGGRDVTPEDFQSKFGFRGGEFGKWVQQGKGDKERQAILNSAYDALMDLANIAGIPPKAISLNGTLGIAFGSRGNGWASAHFEPSNLVINLTKTRGAGTLAHEWLHGLDNYFSRMRRGGEESAFAGSQTEYRNNNYITHRPEPMMVPKNVLGGRYLAPMTLGKLEAMHEAHKNKTDSYNPDNWQRDPKTPEGVRPEVEARFAALVDALNESPMTKRARVLDGTKSGEGYWSRTLERAARAFESYVIAKMHDEGYHNDFLVNVKKSDETGKAGDRYPYLMAGEVKPIAEAFDALFETIQTKEDDTGNVAMFARGTKRTTGVHMDDAEAIIAQTREALPTAPPIIPLESIAQAPADLRKFIRDAGAQDDFEAAYHNGKIFILPSNVGSTKRLQFLLAHHEIRHHGLGAMLGPRKNAVMFAIHATNANVRAAAAEQVRNGYAASKVLATEEALADMPVEDLVKLNGWDKIVAAVRDWLRGAAMRLRRVGLANVADAIEPSAWTDKDVAALVARAEGVSRGGSAKYATEGTVFGLDNVAQFNSDGPAKEFERYKRLVDQVGQEYTAKGSTMTFEEFTAKVKPLQDKMWEAHFKLERWKAGRPATSTEEVFPGFLEIPIGTRIMAKHGMKYPEPTMGTVVGRHGLRMGEKAYVLPEVDFGDGDGRAVLPGDIKEVFAGPRTLFARGGMDGVTDKINTTTKTASNAAALSSVTNTIKTAISPLGTVNLWDRTVGTQYNKATKDRDFKRVFDAFVQQTDDTAHYAIEAETKAPSILMRIDTVKDALKAVVKNGKQQAEDLKVVSKALFANIEGEEGVKSTRYDDDTLRILFGATPRQIEMYHQARAAIDTSIERLAQTYAAQMGGAEGMDMDQVKDMDMADTVEMVKQFIQDKHDELRAEEALRKEGANEDDDPAMDETRALAAEFGPKPAKAPSKAATARLLERLDAMQEQTTSLQQAGYMPAMRFGRFAVTVREPDADEVTHFEMFETRWEANLAAARLQREYPKAEVTKGVMNPEQYAMFKGVSPETVELFAKFTGADQTEAYQDYIALAKSARSVMKRQLKRKGIAGFSQDSTRVMAAFVTSNARQSAINMNIGEITDALASQELARKGDVQREAQKLSEYMSNPLEEARRLRGFMFMHFMGGSVASALVNLTQPILQTAPYLHQFAGAKTASIMASSAKMAATGAIEDKELDAAAKRAREDGITEPHEIHQLMADAGTSTFGNNLRWRAGVKLWASMFSQAESFNRRITFLAAYQVAKQTGKPDPYDFARRAVIETQGLYSKVNRPNWARGAVGATIFTFKQFSIAYLEWLNRLPNKQKVIALAILTLAAGSEGWPFADDLEDLIDTIGQSLGYNTNSKKAKRKFLEETFGQTMGEILNTGVFSQSTVDLSGRLGMGNLLPATAAFKPSETDKARTIGELAGPIAGVLQQFQRALGKAQQGDITGRTGALSQIAPVAVSNALKGMDMAATGIYKDTRGYKVADVDAWESFAKMLGLQPASIALQSRKFSDELQDKGMTTMMEAMIADRWAAGVVDKDLDAVASARDALRTWNEKNPESRIVIKPAQISIRVKKMRETRDDRFLKTVPRENRALAARELQ